MTRLAFVLLSAHLCAFNSNLFAQQVDSNEWADWDTTDAQDDTSHLTGFAEIVTSGRLSTDPVIDGRVTLADLRGQIKWDTPMSHGDVKITADVYYDGVKDDVRLQVREMVWQGHLGEIGAWAKHWDLKLGQQVLTWGTGDYLFLNDMFPKDYQSFFSGRDDEYLKAPSLSAKMSGYFEWINVDLVFTPEFTPDTYINGEHYSFFSPRFGSNIAPEFDVLDENEPDTPEWALRLHTSLDNTDLAIYAYDGFYKSPNGSDALGQARFYPLQVWGASVLLPASDGLFKAEFAYHHSKDDKHGDKPFVPNTQSRLLLGYETELIADMTGSVQWYLEHTHDHAALLENADFSEYEQVQNRQIVTTQIVYRAMQHTLTFSWFNFYSPSDKDGYMRLRTTYSPVDKWRLSAGFNSFYGEHKHTFFAQFKDASNVFASFRYYF